MAAAVCAVVASNLGTMVVMAEIMYACAVFLTGGSKEGKLWFAQCLGTLLLAIACWLVCGSATGTLIWGCWINALSNCRWPDIWLPGVIGFGLLADYPAINAGAAGVTLPALPPPLFSTVVMKIGLLGILTLSLLGAMRRCGGAWRCWCWDDYRLCRRSVRADGATFQRLLAYHTLEKIRISFAPVWAQALPIAFNQPVLDHRAGFADRRALSPAEP
ncbi:hypothetical protein KCP70_05440 [Salmonella enterica subsp. enterica]|nr:hypothetical protein KCP70_05440 [Salmonella enterica subsp. enterica]